MGRTSLVLGALLLSVLLFFVTDSDSRVVENYENVITVNDPDLSSYLVEGLSRNYWYFAVSAFDTSGNESPFSNEASKMIHQDNGTALLSWTPPNTSIDGSQLTDLAGYKIYYSLDRIAPDKGSW